MEAFRDLDSCRAVGMSVGQIPWTAVTEWARENDVLARERFRYLIRQMDDAYMSVLHKDDKATEDSGG
jgi:hypothetical protein